MSSRRALLSARTNFIRKTPAVALISINKTPAGSQSELHLHTINVCIYAYIYIYKYKHSCIFKLPTLFVRRNKRRSPLQQSRRARYTVVIMKRNEFTTNIIPVGTSMVKDCTDTIVFITKLKTKRTGIVRFVYTLP